MAKRILCSNCHEGIKSEGPTQGNHEVPERSEPVLRKRKFRLSLTPTLNENRIIPRFRRLRRDSRFEVRT
jgi:hypothetical protein